MKSNIFIPKTVKVGYQERNDTYTGKLAYVIYYDQKNVLRKEKSWQSWRDKKIEPQDFNNEPSSGFVLNKKVGGDRYGWNPRQTYTRVYDPRGFEFEISIPNLLYILENTSSIKGKGLEGDFVYGWDGTELLLIPVDAPEYKELQEYNNILAAPEVITSKNIILGATYLTNKNEELIYLGKFKAPDGRLKYYFIHDKYYTVIPSLSKKIIKTVEATPVHNYADLVDELQHHTEFAAIDHTKTVFIPLTEQEFDDRIPKDTTRYYTHFYFLYTKEIQDILKPQYTSSMYSHIYDDRSTGHLNKYISCRMINNTNIDSGWSDIKGSITDYTLIAAINKALREGSIKDIYELHKVVTLCDVKQYLTNGKLLHR